MTANAQRRLAELVDRHEWSRVQGGTLGEQIARMAEEQGLLRTSPTVGGGRYVLLPDPVERPKTVRDISRAIAGLPDNAQVFINISGHSEDYAIDDLYPSEQIPVGAPWPTDKRTIGLEIHLGLFTEDTPEAEASDGTR